MAFLFYLFFFIAIFQKKLGLSRIGRFFISNAVFIFSGKKKKKKEEKEQKFVCCSCDFHFFYHYLGGIQQMKKGWYMT